MPMTSSSPNNTSNISALTDYDHSDLSDPWEAAAHLSTDRHVDNAHGRAAPSLSEHAERSCQDSLRIMLRQFFRILDGIQCILLLLWGGLIFLGDDESSRPRAVLLLQALASTLLLTRLTVDCCGPGCGLALSVLYAAVALYGWTEAAALREYLQHHHWLHLPGLEQQVHWLPVVLLSLAAWEILVRWGLHRCVWANRDVDEQEAGDVLIRSSPRRPWWWDRRLGVRSHPSDNRMTRPLLDEDGLPEWVVEGRRQGTRDDDDDRDESRHWFRWPWSRRTVNHDGDGRGIRDDGSVDFASVQEEWASRSVEDPHWWSKDDERAHTSAADTRHRQ